MPDKARVFDQTTLAAVRVHRIPPILLEQLLDLGLPQRSVAGDRRFDSLDLENLGISLGLPSPRRRVMRYWSRTLLRDDHERLDEHPLNVSARCPQPGHSGACHFELNPVVAKAIEPGSLVTGPAGQLSCRVRAAHTERLIGEPFTALIDRLSSFHFHVLPKSLHFDLGFAVETGLATCGLASRLAVRFATEHEVRVRAVFGYLVTPPYLAWHSWCEFDCGGEWLPADPFMLTAMARWGVPGANRWPPNRSCGGLTWRIGEIEDLTAIVPRFHPVMHGGEPAPFTLMAQERTA
ncbi:transglutaminase domain-containing protein [Streptomyces sp. BK205]|uniref:transglutaminase domain-containing protein n=1 Tax=Streptomyces sp. BK205 TaxID=2512164 RepID=UPI00104778C3|nr:transglutaminase domain-containing protein [Streptomyces sp. BK205]